MRNRFTTKTLPARYKAQVAADPATPKTAMNKTETEYRNMLMLRPDVLSAEHETVKFRIGGDGERCWYTPDFRVVLRSGAVEIHEVKGGYEREDARVKRLSAARFYREYRWVIARKLKTGWKIEEMKG